MTAPASVVETEVFSFQGMTLDVMGRTLVDPSGTEVTLRHAEFELLLAFLRHPGRALSRDTLLNAVSGRRAEPFDRSIDVHVGRLRQKIEPDPRKPSLIVTVPGVGYKFAAKLVPVAPDETPITPQSAAPTPAARPAERRQVTVACYSLDGYGALAARLDPEDLRGIVDAFQRCCADAVARFGGFLAQRSGGEATAWFGWPEAREHAAEWAVRAALAATAAVAHLPAGAAGPLTARAAIATGPVLVGGGASPTDAPDMLGEAPTLAAALLARAPSGAVVIAEATRRLVGGLFDFSPVLSGDDAPGFAVVGGSGGENRFAALRGDKLTPLVGRDEELALLKRRWRQATSGIGRLILLGAEPGIGKSRLIHEFRARLADEPHTPITCFCAPHQQDSAYHPIVAHLERAAGFASGDDAAMRLDKLEALLAPAEADPEAITLIADLLSVPTDGRYPPLTLSPRQLRVHTIAALTELLVGTARRSPVLLVFEDVHWIDPTSREVLEVLIERAAELPVLLIVTHRPEFVPPWTTHSRATTVLLTRLDGADAVTMVAAAGGGALPPDLRRQIAERAEGLPLYVEELTKAALEGGAASVPASLRDSLMARLDRLPAAKRAAQLGAAIGRSFSHDLIAAIAEGSLVALDRGLDALSTAGLIARRDATVDGTFTFKHALIQDAAYDSLAKADRMSIHARIADALGMHDPKTEQTDPALLAYHCERGGRPAEGCRHYLSAGWRSEARGALAEAHLMIEASLRAISMLPTNDVRDRLEMTSLLALCYVQQVHFGHAHSARRPTLDRMQELHTRMGEPGESYISLFYMWVFLINRGDIDGASQKAKELYSWGERHNDDRGRIFGLFTNGLVEAKRGDFRTARAEIEQAIKLRERFPPRSPDAKRHDPVFLPIAAWGTPHLFLSIVLAWLGYPDQAMTQAELGVQFTGAVHSVSIDIDYLAMSIRTSMFLLPPPDLIARVEVLGRRAEEHGLPHHAAAATILKGYLIATNVDSGAGRALIEAGLETYTATDAESWTCWYRALLAEARQRLGETDEARRLLIEELEKTAQTGELWYVAELHRRIGEAHRQLGSDADAARSFEEALAVARDQSAKLWELQAATSYARMLRDQGQPGEARAVLGPVYAWFTEGFDTVPLRAAKALLDELRTAPY